MMIYILIGKHGAVRNAAWARKRSISQQSIYIHCPTCDEQIEIEFHLCEYPVGAVNYTDIYVEGGEIISEVPNFSDKMNLFGDLDD